MSVDWEAVARRELHPTRVRILEAAGEASEVSPVALAREFEEPLGNVSYHVRALAENGLLRETRTEPRRGALQHFYALVARPK